MSTNERAMTEQQLKELAEIMFKFDQDKQIKLGNKVVNFIRGGKPDEMVQGFGILKGVLEAEIKDKKLPSDHRAYGLVKDIGDVIETPENYRGELAKLLQNANDFAKVSQEKAAVRDNSLGLNSGLLDGSMVADFFGKAGVPVNYSYNTPIATPEPLVAEVKEEEVAPPSLFPNPNQVVVAVEPQAQPEDGLDFGMAPSAEQDAAYKAMNTKAAEAAAKAEAAKMAEAKKADEPKMVAKAEKDASKEEVRKAVIPPQESKGKEGKRDAAEVDAEFEKGSKVGGSLALLKKGSGFKPQIAFLQDKLIELGYLQESDPKADNYISPKHKGYMNGDITVDAVKKFQGDIGLKKDGVVYEDTWFALRAAVKNGGVDDDVKAEVNKYRDAKKGFKTAISSVEGEIPYAANNLKIDDAKLQELKDRANNIV